MVGNVKESVVPYAMKYLKHAKLSFDMYGAVSPTKEKSNDDMRTNETSSSDENNQENHRKFSQVELESSLAQVINILL